MSTESLHSLAAVFSQVPDPRSARGIRHPFSGILGLVFLGLLARIREPAELQFWAEVHWDELKEPLGFDRDRPPHATTMSRTLANFSLEDFYSKFRKCMAVLPGRTAWLPSVFAGAGHAPVHS